MQRDDDDPFASPYPRTRLYVRAHMYIRDLEVLEISRRQREPRLYYKNTRGMHYAPVARAPRG